MAGPAAPPVEAPAAESVPIELGPDVALYPETFRPTEQPKEPTPAVQESTEEQPQSDQPVDAGASDTEPKGTRRQRGEEAYQRGLREGREAAERERTERTTLEAQSQAAEAERAKIRQLFIDLKSPDYDTRTNASSQLADIYSTTEQTQAIELQTRTRVLEEIGSQFKDLAQIDGIGDDGHQALMKAQSPADFAKTAFELGQKQAKAQADERIAELEAQLEEARGRRAATSLTPERSNGSNGAGGRLTLEQYQRMTPAEIRKAGITSADIDAMVADMMNEAERARR